MSLVGESRIFVPHRALGLVCGHVPIVVRYVKDAKLTKLYAAVGNFVHAYSAHNLGLVSVSEPLPSNVQSLACDDRFVYVGFGTTVAALYRDRNVRRLYEGHDSDVAFLVPFGDHLLVVDRNSALKVWEIDTGDLYGEWRFGGPAFSISAVCHPATYLNKIILGSTQGPLKLVNVKTGKVIFDFDGWGAAVSCLEQSTAVDVVGVGLKDGRIYLHNLKFNETIVSFRQDWGAVTAITFRTDGPPLMVTGSSAGHAAVWDLDKRKLYNQILDAHRDAESGVSTLITLQNEPTVVSAGADNALKMWIFDLSDGGARLLNSQEGHGKSPTFVRFHGGERGQYVISAGGDADVKMFHTTCISKNRNLGQAASMRKKEAKKRHLNFEELRFPPIAYLASDATRESGWDNVVCCHEERSVVTTWTSRRTRLGSHKLRHERFGTVPDWRNATSVCCAVSACGNFTMVGYSSGHVDVFNIQSGIYRGSFVDASGERAHTASVTGVASDGLNKRVITGCSEGRLKFWLLSNKKLIHSMQLAAGVTRMALHRDNDLLALVLDDQKLVIVDAECRRVVRLFENAHRDRVTDLAFSPTGHWVVTASLDGTVKVWDVPSSSLVDVVAFPTPCVSLTMSPSGEYLATAHKDELGVYLWVNKTLFTPLLTLKPLPIDFEPAASMMLPSSEATLERTVGSRDGAEPMDEGIDDRYNTPDQIDESLVTFSGLPTPRWACLLDMDVIKERNKPIEPAKKPEKAPFFLPTVPGVTPVFDVEKESNVVDGQSRISTVSKLQPKSDFMKAVESPEENFESVSDALKKLSPAGVEIELRNLAPISGGSIESMKKFLRSIDAQLNSRRSFEVCNAHLSLFVKLHRDLLWSDLSLREALERTKKSQMDSWNRLDDLFNETLCLVQYLKSSVL